jgi:hypothetical protein
MIKIPLMCGRQDFIRRKSPMGFSQIEHFHDYLMVVLVAPYPEYEDSEGISDKSPNDHF